MIGCGNEDVVMSTGGTGEAAGASDVSDTAGGSTGAEERTRRYAELLSKQRDVASTHTHLDKVHLLILGHLVTCSRHFGMHTEGERCISHLKEAKSSGKLPLATLCSRCFAGGSYDLQPAAGMGKTIGCICMCRSGSMSHHL